MASTKFVATLLVCVVIMVASRISNAEDQERCFKDCEKFCVNGGNAHSFCVLKCERECRKGNLSRRFN
ncbi:putative pollen allergen ole e 6 [Helianthus annuus]|uniref:Pollen allergen ole e 6 n=1 Tax=Helianthus annuus TaxID=4232 RepID=A0A251S5B2_HELAN|nr:putative pollen allergen ole e 6 [Helianthus annuus]KAJ0829778.1 putative pollen allergen ole e 6 [Helianthus annuus]